MARIWSDAQLERATTPQARDIRGKAFLSAINRMLGDRPLPGPHIRDPRACPAEVLPELIAEYSMEEFITPGLKEEYVRALLARTYELKRGKGYVAGIRLGLNLIGVKVEWVQWFEETPKAAPNTHRVTAIFDKALFNDLPVGDLHHRRAVTCIINTAKRFSQDEDVQFVIRARQQARVGAHSRIGGIVRTLALKPADQTERSRATLAAISRRGGVHHTKGLAA